MTEILTESFCERCGTRYTFESARPRVRLKGVRVLSRGLKNFVLSDDNSIDEAMAAARSDTDRELTSHQLDAFHKTFNFCMSCRQYTCPNCWNEAEARCLTCAPHLGQEVMPAPFPDLVTSSYLVADPVETVGANGANGANTIAHDSVAGRDQGMVDTSDFASRLQALMAPPALDEPGERVAGAEPVSAAPDAVEAVGEAEAVAEVEAAAEAPAALEAVVVAADIQAGAADVEPVAAETEPVAIDDAAAIEESDGAAEIAARLAAWSAAAVAFDAARDEPATTPTLGEKGAAQTGGLLRRFRAGQNLDAELDAYEAEEAGLPVGDALEAEAAAVAAEPEVKAIATASETEAVAAAEPEFETIAEPEPVAAEPAPPIDDLIAQPTWQMVAPDPAADLPPGKPTPPSMPAAATLADPTAEPQWPARPEWPGGVSPAAGLPFLNRPPAPTGGLEALWAESAREVVAPPTVAGRPVATGGVQPCVSCGLSLSATARFCRRCGTPQAL